MKFLLTSALTVCLIVLCNVGAKAQLNASTSNTSGCLPFTITITDASGAGIPEMGVDWGEGNGMQSVGDITGQQITHTYFNPGSVNIEYHELDGAGNTMSVMNFGIDVMGGQNSMDGIPSTLCPNQEFKANSWWEYDNSTVWHWGDGTTSNGSGSNGNDILHTYTTPGVYNITLTYDGNGCTGMEIHQSVTVDATLVPDPSFNMPGGPTCPGFMHNLSAMNDNQGDWTWDLGNQTHNGENINVAFTNGLSWNYVTATVSNACGNDSSKIDSIFVAPVVPFDAALVVVNSGDAPPNAYPNGTACPGDLFAYALSGTNGTLTNYQRVDWDFGDNTPIQSNINQNGEEAVTVHAYANAGSYVINATIISPCGNDTVITRNMTVNNSTNFVLIDPESNPFNVWPDKVCPGQPVSLNAHGYYGTYIWNYGDGSPADTTGSPDIQYTYPGVGNYTPTLTLVNGCGNDSVFPMAVEVMSMPHFGDPNQNYDIQGELSVCPNSMVSLNGSWGQANYSWDFGDGALSPYNTNDRTEHFYAALGDYPIRLTMTSHCETDTIILDTVHVVNNQPINIWNSGKSADKICPGQELQLWAQGSFNQMTFDWGDGSPVYSTSEEYGLHVYNNLGVHHFSVTLTNTCNIQLILTDSVSVENGLNPQIQNTNSWPSIACPGERFKFEVDRGYATYEWDLGDGTVIQGPNEVEHRYTNPGTYNVQVTVTNHCNNSTVVNMQATVDGNAPIDSQNANIDVSPVPACPGDAVQFRADEDFVWYKWEYGDGTMDSTLNRSSNHAYAVSGNYTAYVTVGNLCGNQETFPVNVQVLDNAPISSLEGIQLGAPVGCPNDYVLFAPDGGSGSYMYEWNFGDGTPNDTTLGTGVVHQFATDGTYEVTLVATNGCGNTATVNTFYTIDGGAMPIMPQAFGTPGESGFAGCPGDAIIFYFWGIGPNEWDFGDGTTATATEIIMTDEGFPVTFVQHLFTSPGVYHPTLTMFNACGNSISDSTTIVVGGGNLPVNGEIFIASPFEGSDHTTCAPVPFVGIGGQTYTWDFGDGTGKTTVSPNVNHSYGVAGTYQVALTVTNGCGNSEVLYSSVDVLDGDNAVVTVDQVTDVTCIGGNDGSATVSVAVAGGAELTYEWDDDDNQASETATGLAAGDYEVVVTAANGCSAIGSVVVAEGATMDVTFATNNAACGLADGDIATTVAGGTPPYTYEWANGQVGATMSALPWGAYAVTITDSNGCIEHGFADVSESGAATVSGSTVVDPSCNGIADGSIDIDMPVGTYTFMWSDGSSSEDLSGILAGTYLVTVTDTAGCMSVAVFDVVDGSELDAATTVIGADCAQSNGSATVEVTGGTTPYLFDWSNGETSATITGLAASDYNVTVTDDNGCEQIIEANVENLDAPQIDAAVSVITCFGEDDGSIDLTISGGTNPYTFLWPHGAVSEDVTGLDEDDYVAFVTDAVGCVSIFTYEMIEPALMGVSVTESYATCNGSNGSLWADVDGGTEPYDYAWSDASTTESLTGLDVGSLTVSVTDDHGCEASASGEVVLGVMPMDICVATVDRDLNQNLIVWEKIDGFGIEEFNIYRETGVTDVYELIGTVPFASQSEYLDTDSDPSAHADRYKMTAVDSCGNESEMSAHHKTMLLQTANGVVPGTVGLDWTAYEGMGVASYVIYRSVDGIVFDELAAVSGANLEYNDNNVPISGDPTLIYEIDILMTEPCTSTRAAVNHNSSRSNTANISNPGDTTVVTPDGILRFETSLKIGLFPNPNQGQFNILLNTKEAGSVTVNIFDLSGKLIDTKMIAKGEGTRAYPMNVTGLSTGIYNVQVITPNRVGISKLVIE